MPKRYVPEPPPLQGSLFDRPKEIHRLFFALMPDESTAARITTIADALQAEHGLRHGQEDRQDQREMAELRDHSDARAGIGWCRDSATSGGM